MSRTNSNSQMWPWPRLVVMVPYNNMQAPQHSHGLPLIAGPPYHYGSPLTALQDLQVPYPGPNRNYPLEGRRRARAQNPYNTVHESSPTIRRDRLNPSHPVNRWMSSNNPRSSGASRPRQGTSHSQWGATRPGTQQIERLDRDDRPAPRVSETLTRDLVDPLVYEIHMRELEADATTGGSTLPAPIPPAPPSHAPAKLALEPPSASMSAPVFASGPASALTEITSNANVDGQLDDEDFDTVSLGSED